MKIAQRHTLFSRREEVRLTESGISRIRGQKTVQVIRFKDIKSIQLLCDGYSTGHEKVVYKCVVRAPGKSLTFSNALYNDPQPSMDDQYQSIVRRLHRKVRSNSSETSFTQGSNIYYVLGWFILIFGSLSLAVLPLMFILALLEGKDWFPLVRKSWVMALLPLAIMGVALPLIRLGRKSKYDPLSIPREYLP